MVGRGIGRGREDRGVECRNEVKKARSEGAREDRRYMYMYMSLSLGR